MWKLSDGVRSKNSFDLDFFKLPKHQLILKGCMSGSFSGKNDEFKFKFSASSLYRLFSEKPVDWLSEWYINGPNTPFYFIRSTDRDLEFVYKKTRIKNFYFRKNPRRVTSRDYSLIKFKFRNEDILFIIHSVPTHYNPQWSKKIGIEYRGLWGIPEANIRQRISEIISFLLGRQLIKIGETKFDEKGFPIEESLTTPNTSHEINLNNLSKTDDINPIPYSIHSSKETNPYCIETCLNQIIPQYIEKCDELNLNEVLWRYWLSKSLPSYAKLVILAGSLELLSKSWHDFKESKSHGKYLPKKEFRKLSNEISSLKEAINKLNDEKQEYENFEENKQKISHQLSQLNNMGPKASIENFFKEIGLEIGDIESKSIQFRNIPAHGNIIDSVLSKKMEKCEDAYLTLLNRVLLKILGYKGRYIDYYNHGTITREIDDPITN